MVEGLTAAPEETKARWCWLDATPDSPSLNKGQRAPCQHMLTLHIHYLTCSLTIP